MVDLCLHGKYPEVITLNGWIARRYTAVFQSCWWSLNTTSWLHTRLRAHWCMASDWMLDKCTMTYWQGQTKSKLRGDSMLLAASTTSACCPAAIILWFLMGLISASWTLHRRLAIAPVGSWLLRFARSYLILAYTRSVVWGGSRAMSHGWGLAFHHLHNSLLRRTHVSIGSARASRCDLGNMHPIRTHMLLN